MLRIYRNLYGHEQNPLFNQIIYGWNSVVIENLVIILY
jgi:hypothetical protein